MSVSLYFSNHHKMEKEIFDGQEFSYPSMVRLEAETLNVTGSNGFAIICALGLAEFNCNDCAGTHQIPVRELWAACGRFLTSEMAEVIDGGTPDVKENNFILCGRREGYFTDRINQMKEECEAAMALNATHAYFA